MGVSFSRPRSIWSHHRWTTPGCILTCGLTHCVEVSPWSSRTLRLKTSRRPSIVLSDRASPESFASSVWSMKRIAWATMLRPSGRTRVCWWSAWSIVSCLFLILRADHVIIQSYEEELDDQRLYVALFVKDPYRHSIALTNGQVLQALEQFQEELYQDIKHQVNSIRWREWGENDREIRFQINLPSKIFEKNILDPLWLYGACLLALIVLLVVILMLMTILMKKT